jgi:hypothetical protein
MSTSPETAPAFTPVTPELCPNLYKVFDPNIEAARQVIIPNPYQSVDVPASPNIFLIRPATFIPLSLFLSSSVSSGISPAIRTLLASGTFPLTTTIQTPINNYSFTLASTVIGRTNLGKPFQISPQGVIQYGYPTFVSPFAQAFN